MSLVIQELTLADLDDLRHAKELLENPSFAARLANAVGGPIEMGFQLLPRPAREIIAKVTNRSLEAALGFATSTMSDELRPASNFSHKLAAVATGAVGGCFGLLALAVELPISTTIMLRSIVDVARSEGEPISTPEAKLACLE